MSLRLPIRSSPPHSGLSPGRRRLGAWLLTGWAAFWLSVVTAPFCGSVTASAQAGHESTAIERHVQGPAGDGAHELPCPDLSHAQPAPPVTTVAPFDAPSKAIDPPPLRAALPLFSANARVEHPADDLPPPVPYHRRSARLLI